ncbi:hypothetical protein D6810_02990, partial [Candidatus Dojkabacteria bacterium]
MFKINGTPQVISLDDFGKSLLTGDYKWKYPAAKLFVKPLLICKPLLKALKQSLNLNWNSICENIDNLSSACKEPNIAKLIAQLIDPKDFSFDNFCYLFKATSESDIEDFIIAIILYNNDIVLNARDLSLGRTFLHEAVQSGLVKTCEALIKRGCCIDSTDKQGQTPLYYAIYYGYQKVVRLLLDKGANVNFKDKDGLTPLHLAIKIAYLNTSDRLDSALHNNYFDVIQALQIAIGIKPIATIQNMDLRSRIENFILLYLNRIPIAREPNNYLEIIKLLLEYGADVNAKDYNNCTPLCVAAAHGHLENAQGLFNSCADTSVENNNTWMSRTKLDHLKIIKMLLDYGAKVNTKDKYGKTPLCWATEIRCWEIIRMLSKHGADINAPNSQNETFLYLAAKNGDLEFVNILLECG